MSRKETVFLMSRAFALLLIVWAVVDVTYMPERLFSLFHYLSQRSVLGLRDFWSSRYMLITLFAVVRIGSLLLSAWCFWKNGPWVERLFSLEHSDQGKDVESS